MTTTKLIIPALVRGATPVATPLSPVHGMKILYVAGAPIDLLEVHRRHYGPSAAQGRSQSSLVDLFEMCERHDMKMHVISSHPTAEYARQGRFVLEHRPRAAASGLRYYADDIAYARHMVRRARELEADAVIVESGTVHFFAMSLLKMAGFTVIPLIHHALWAPGHPPKKLGRRALRWANRRFFRKSADSVICVSPACERQVRVESGNDQLPVHQIRLQLDPQVFEKMDVPPPHHQSPFGVIFTGRVESDKGVFDMVEMIDALEHKYPGRLRWFILGDGSARERLAATLEARGLAHLVELPGWVSPQQMTDYYAKAHVAIVPTRAEIGEGMAMAAVEAVIAGRPVVTSSVVPALEVLRPACVEAQVDDASSYVVALERLMNDEALYNDKHAACSTLGWEFFDRQQGLAAVVEQVLTRDIVRNDPAIPQSAQWAISGAIR